MGVFSLLKQKEKIIAIFHVGSGHVAGALVRFDGGDPSIPTLVVVKEEPIAGIGDSDFSGLRGHMQKSLAHVARELAKSGASMPDEIHCFLGAPWYTSVSRTIVIEKRTPFVFTKEMANEYIRKEIENAKKETLAAYSFKEDGVVVVDQKLLGTALNGYALEDPYNKRTVSAKLSLFGSFTPESVVTALKAGIKSGFSREPVVFHSFLVAGAVVSRSLLATTPNFAFVDIGSEISDVSIVHAGTIAATATFPYGSRFVIRRIMSEMRCDHDAAVRLFTLSLDGMLAEPLAGSVKKVLAQTQLDWQHALTQAFLAVTNSFCVPTAIVLTADAPYAPWFQAAVEAEEFHCYQLTEKKFSVLLLDRGTLMPYVRNENGASLNHFLMIEAAFINNSKSKTS